jgi:hypothetical protein
MPDYQNGNIYKIFNTIDDDVYIGSTTEQLNIRLNKHKYKSKIENSNLNKKMVEFGVDNF